MKMSRRDLKVLVKECLVEILADGLGENLNEQIKESTTPRAMPKSQGRPQYRSMTSPARHGGQEQGRLHAGLPTAALRAAVMETSHGNPIMQDILADTAMTSLPTMLSSAPGTPPTPRAGTAEAVVAASPPEEIFSEGAGRWADLAFRGESSGRSTSMFSPVPPQEVRKLSNAELDAPTQQGKKTA